jgi:hypothetical protein
MSSYVCFVWVASFWNNVAFIVRSSHKFMHGRMATKWYVNYNVVLVNSLKKKKKKKKKLTNYMRGNRQKSPSFYSLNIIFVIYFAEHYGAKLYDGIGVFQSKVIILKIFGWKIRKRKIGDINFYHRTEIKLVYGILE